jgi:uncharacterized protein YkwD
VALALGVLTTGAAAGTTPSRPVVPKQGVAAQALFERQVFREINRTRHARGLGKLRRSKTLKRAARSHSTYQARIGRMTHYGKGRMKFSTRLARFGYRRSVRTSEVIGVRTACDRGDPKILVRAWLRSRPHRALLLDRRVRNMGVGVVSIKQCRRTYYTVDFGG